MAQTIASVAILTGEWNFAGAVEYRIHAWQNWISATGERCAAGSPYDLSMIDNTYRKDDCDVADKTVTLPAITLERTDNAQEPLGGVVRLCLSLFDKTRNRHLITLVESFQVTSTTNSLDDLL